LIKQLIGDSREILKTLESESVQCCVTSPPYWGLRDYGHGGQIGLESTFEEYIDNLISVFDEVKRVLKNDGTLWVNLGDTYSGNSSVQAKGRRGFGSDKIGNRNNKSNTIQEKSLCQLPSRVSIEMINPRYRCCFCGWNGRENQAIWSNDYYCPLCGERVYSENGWILRNTIIWKKPNCMPESVKDRFTNDFEYLYFFSKSKNYYFKQQLESQKEISLRRAFSKNNPEIRKGNNNGQEPYTINHENQSKYHEKLKKSIIDGEPLERNKRCVWEIPTKSYRGGHFAVFPHELIIPCILAGSKEGDIVLDPFAGSGTTGEVALRYNREAILIELNPDYVKLQDKRTTGTQTYFEI